MVLAFLFGSMSLGMALPEFSYFASAKAGARTTFGIIERVSCLETVSFLTALLATIF